MAVRGNQPGLVDLGKVGKGLLCSRRAASAQLPAPASLWEAKISAASEARPPRGKPAQQPPEHRGHTVSWHLRDQLPP